eukprot:6412445-Lingulodinium_polyedra.AAC.1
MVLSSSTRTASTCATALCGCAMVLTTRSGSTSTCGTGCEPQPPRASSPSDGSRRAAPRR